MRYVYTSVTAGRDLLRSPGPLPAGWRAICFTDEHSDHPDWEIRDLTDAGGSPVRNARMHKLLPHRFLPPDTELSLWIDGNWTIECDLDWLVATFLEEHEIVFNRHPQRDCVYDEADACIELLKDEPRIINEQIRRYQLRGYPRHNGLVTTGVVLRRNTDGVRSFCEQWWRELVAGSHRDQVSASYVLFETGIPFGLFGWDHWSNPHFTRCVHDGPASPRSRGEAARRRAAASGGLAE